MMQFFRKNTKPIMAVVVALFVVSCFAMYGGRRSRPAETPESVPGNGAENVVQDRPVAVVDGKNIMLSQIETQRVQMIENLSAMQQQTISEDQYPLVRLQILQQTAMLAEIDKEVQSRDISISAEELDTAVKNIENSFQTKELYLQWLQGVGETETSIRGAIEGDMKRQKVIEQVTADVSADMLETRNYYEMVKDFYFQKPEGFMMNIAHFASADKALAARNAIEEGKTWDEVMEPAVASGDIFRYTAYDNPTLVPTMMMEGELAFLKDYPMNKLTEIVSLDVSNQLLAIKRSKEEAGVVPFDDVSADLRMSILDQKRQGVISQFLQGLIERADIEILDKTLFPPEPEAPASANVTSADSAAASADATPADDTAPGAEEPQGAASADAVTEQPEAETPATEEKEAEKAADDTATAPEAETPETEAASADESK